MFEKGKNDKQEFSARNEWMDETKKKKNKKVEGKYKRVIEE